MTDEDIRALPHAQSGEIISFVVPGEPVPFARAGANGKARFTPRKQADFMAAIRLYAQQAMGETAPIDGPVELCLRAEYLVPASWPKKKKDAAKWKASKPDADNLAKIFKDAMNTIVWKDDAQVASLTVQKTYGLFARVTVTVAELAP
jgi:Holliday junction resolvase RusA-like endonuclease